MKKAILIFLVLSLLLLQLPVSAQLKNLELPTDVSTVSITTIKKLGDKDAEDLAKQLNQCPQITECDLSSVSLSLKAAAILREKCPQICFHFILTVSGKKIDSLSEELDLDVIHIASKIKWSELTKLLACMQKLKEVTMEDCRFDLQKMESLFADYPDVIFHWTIRNNGMKFKAGVTAYSTLKGRQDPRYTSEDMAPLVEYCPDLLALDVGHNDVSDLSFLQAWPHLKRLIVIDSKTPVTDLTPLADLNELEYVELFMQNITDLTPLANKTELLDLNLCHNDITDLSPLYSCTKLERLWISYNPNLSQEEIDRLQEKLPNCHIESEVYSSTGAGWREHERYEIMVQSFTEQNYIPFDEK